MIYIAFWTVIEAQGTPEQSAKWLEAAKRHAVLGCYGQTELSHGSNVARLQTTATYDEATEEFIINSPDITAAKWWIGGLGVACTHSALQAQLIVKGKNYGPHIFIVPVRSPCNPFFSLLLVNLKPVKGVTVGDIGPKAYGGFATTDNGYCIFDHVRIPRDNMLMRFAQVSKEGVYSPPVHSKASYGSMVRLRVGILSDAGWKLAKAATIAVRYCTSRRQFNTDQNGLESQVISYSSVRHRLYPLVATAYALILSSLDFYKQFDVLAEQLLRQDASLLPEMHVNSCAFKIWGTRRSTEGIEEARKSMGGHGFSIFSGVAELYSAFVPSNTYEGDNYMLSQQVGRAMLKQLDRFNKGMPYSINTAKYLDTLKTNPTFKLDVVTLHDPEVQLTLFAKRAARLVANLGSQVQAGRPWTDLNMECWDICFAHAEYLLLKQLIATVKEFKKSAQHEALVPVIQNVSNLVFTVFCYILFVVFILK
ncbi:acyl-CoA dehydrogenase/oxidase C-terminal [Phascolomyces articulosus]|uniref:acyl-CoA oxidase n=1 Tax=Phascolomyces articulosus TaxID=60185 RepID=A0AAD5K1Y1_9FUNG|nr:acyl-CoA dehydrogenase/oxidase C-terminal [Phascolomyces articulosus]